MTNPIDKSRLTVWHGSFSPDMALADLHVHTRRSDGWWLPERLAEAAIARGLDAIAITDHDDLQAGFDLADYVSRRNLPLAVYPGAEVSALENGRDLHVIGVGLREPIKPWQSLQVTVEAILAQDAIPIIPHAKTDNRRAPSFEQLLTLDLPVAIEIYNAATADFPPSARRRGESNEAVRRFYGEHQSRFLAAVGGTDAHLRTVGRGITGYRGDLLTALRQGQTVVLSDDSREHMMPWDLAGYALGLRRLAERRRIEWGFDRPRSQ